MKKVKPAIEGKKIKTVTFIWLQGESDAQRIRTDDDYEASFKGMVQTLEKDLDRKDINLVIARISDTDMENKRFKRWTMIRDLQVKLAKELPRATWVNTDDLNNCTVDGGKTFFNDLHYTSEGYKILGKRYAEKAIELIKKNTETKGQDK
jgi:lysophospholipase L1-like esterase